MSMSLPPPPRAVIRCKWPTTCRECGRRIDVGVEIMKYGTGLNDGWQHVTCWKR